MTRALLVLLCGCHQLFGVTEVKLDTDATDLDSALPADLIAYYPMDSIDSMVEDVVGDHDGMCVTCPTMTEGRIAGGLMFDGALTLVDVSGTPDLATTTGFTAAVWVKLDVAPTTFRCAVGKVFGGTGDNSWQICVDSQMRVVIYGTGTASAIGGPVTAGAWTHLAARWDAATSQLAVFSNGLFGVDETETLMFDGSPLTIGADRDGGGPTSYWSGALDDVRIYNRALTDAEIADLATP